MRQCDSPRQLRRIMSVHPRKSRKRHKSARHFAEPSPARARRKAAAPRTSVTVRSPPAYVVRHSPIHGRGVFAARTIRKGADIVEYRGQRISVEEADALPDSDPDNPYHTFLFELADGRLIDAGVRGNAARWVNHSCRPNCEPYEDEEGRVFIAAKRTIRAGEELAYDYQLSLPGRRSARMIANYACRCGAPHCRGTMLRGAKGSRK